VAIESVAGSDKEAGLESLSPEDCQSVSNPLPLQRWIYAREFCLSVQTKKRSAVARAQVTVSMHRDRGASRLQRPHSIPELWIRSLSIQIGVLIVWDDSENRRDAVMRENRQESLAPVLQHSRAEIIETDEVLRLPWFHRRRRSCCRRARTGRFG
jgi:hypothetical protein